MIKGGKGEQLPLFMSTSELLGKATHIWDRQEGEATDSFWSRKEQEARQPHGTVTTDPEDDPGEMAHGAGVYDSVKQHGMTSHILLDAEDIGGQEKWGIMDGYHRVAAAAAIERETGRSMFIPVLHGDGARTSPSGRDYIPATSHWPQNKRPGWFKGQA